MDNNSPNINTTSNYLSPQTTEHNENHDVCPRNVQVVNMLIAIFKNTWLQSNASLAVI
jgi:hypothetical protein